MSFENNRESRIYKELNESSVIRDKGLLWFLVSYFCSRYVTGEIGCQTTGEANDGFGLVGKIKGLDEIYEGRIGGNRENKANLAEFEKRVEERLKADMKERIEKFKEMELGKIRIEEKEKLRTDMENWRIKVENGLKEKAKVLEERPEGLGERN